MELKCDAVFQGGGVKGIGLVGAVSAIEKAGYKFENLAGTSAGAIVAALLAVDYTASEIEEVLRTVDYKDFEDETFLSELGGMGKFIGGLLQYGIYKGDFFENWLHKLLLAKGKTTFGQIKIDNPSQEKYRYKFQAIAADITDKRLLILPADLRKFGLGPDEYSIAAAVRMSMSIPIFFKPAVLTDPEGKIHYIVDGGTISNYPVWLLDDGTSAPPWPTFGFKLVEDDPRIPPKFEADSIHTVIDYLKSLVGTCMNANDNYHISVSQGDFARTICIPVTVEVNGVKKKIGTVDFDIKPEESAALFNNGLQAGTDFLSTWDFSAWKEKYRG